MVFLLIFIPGKLHTIRLIALEKVPQIRLRPNIGGGSIFLSFPPEEFSSHLQPIDSTFLHWMSE